MHCLGLETESAVLAGFQDEADRLRSAGCRCTGVRCRAWAIYAQIWASSRERTWFMSMDWRASLKQKMTAAFWFSGLPSPSLTPALLSGFAGNRTLDARIRLRVYDVRAVGFTAANLPSPGFTPTLLSGSTGNRHWCALKTLIIRQ